MYSKVILVLCAQAIFIQTTFSQCTSRAAVNADPGIIGPATYGLSAQYGFPAQGLAAPYGLIEPALVAPYGVGSPYGIGAPCGAAAPAIEFSPTSGGALPVSSSSAIAPVGLSVASENIYEGILAAAGEVPFVGTVGVEGVLPTAGAGAVHHACGSGINIMVSDKTALAPGYIGAAYTPAAAAITPAIATPALGYRADCAPKSCGYGL